LYLISAEFRQYRNEIVADFALPFHQVCVVTSQETRCITSGVQYISIVADTNGAIRYPRLSPSLRISRFRDLDTACSILLPPVREALLLRLAVDHSTDHDYRDNILARTGLVESALREYERGEETIRHVILSYVRWAEECRELQIGVKERAGEERFLLGG
jgi:hypothetical protein